MTARAETIVPVAPPSPEGRKCFFCEAPLRADGTCVLACTDDLACSVCGHWYGEDDDHTSCVAALQAGAQ